MNIPQGFSTVTPYFIMEDADAFVRFLKDAFGAVEIGRSNRPDGKIANCQVTIGTSTLMVGEASDYWPSMPASYYLYVADANFSMETAIAAGAEVEMEVSDQPYGDRQGGVRDPFGNVWWISQRMTDKAYF